MIERKMPKVASRLPNFSYSLWQASVQCADDFSDVVTALTASLLQYALLSRKSLGHRKDSAENLQSLHSALCNCERSRPEGKKKTIAYAFKIIHANFGTGCC